MIRPKEIIGALYFSDFEPRIIGHLTIGDQHFEIDGLRRRHVRTDLTGRRVDSETSGTALNVLPPGPEDGAAEA